MPDLQYTTYQYNRHAKEDTEGLQGTEQRGCAHTRRLSWLRGVGLIKQGLHVPTAML
jgi:hypothetical protein